MPITSITIENFKGVGERVTVPIRPITLLFGANSAGKSTILQALLYLRELLERKTPDADVLSGCGGAINLGGFRELVHRRDVERKVRIGVTTTVDDDGLPEFPIARADDENASDYEPGADTYPHSVKTAGIILEVEHHPIEGPWISTYTVEINGAVQGSITCQPGEVAKIVVQPESRLCKLFLRLLGLVLVEDDELDDDCDFIEEDDAASDRPPDPERDAKIKEFAETLAAKINEAEKAFVKLVALGTEMLQSGELFEYADGVIPQLERGISSLGFSDVFDTAELVPPKFQIHRVLSQVFAGTGQLVLNELKRIRYIGPIREVPSRNFQSERSPSPSRWADGSAAWDVLHTAKSKPDWLREKTWTDLGLGYQLDFAKFIEIPASGPLGAALLAAAATPLVPAVIDPLKMLLMGAAQNFQARKKAFAGFAERYRFRLLSENTKLPVAPQDVGVGVSQVLPVAIGAMQPGYSVLAIEQPELHVHPAVQCRLGDLFIRALHESSDRLLFLETHSEHLMLRLMRRIRETAAGNVPDQGLALSNEMVQVLFVEVHDGQTIFRQMPLNAKGEWVREWPGGFFEEDLEEMF